MKIIIFSVRILTMTNVRPGVQSKPNNYRMKITQISTLFLRLKIF